MAVLLDVRSASGSVGDDDFDVRAFECVDGFLCEFYCRRFFPRVDQQRSAAGLRVWRDDFAAFGGENAGSGGIDLRKKLTLHAAQEQANTAALRAHCRRDFSGCLVRPEFWEKGFHRLQLLWQELKQPRAAQERL